ncbi:MAG: histidine kinase [Burkholderiales bacterium RIFCSPLOWO2_02_FULL_57_36]|nr:MAG: histidine kinase [Burkholderiales bacterium RIFCSPLOWO2_02_FULL_57_36]
MNLSTPSAPHPYPRLRRFAIDVAITSVFNVMIAVVITYVMQVHNNFLVNLTISMCIGTLAVTFIDGGRLLLWGLERPPKLAFFLLLAVALPAAQQLGNIIAAQITGVPAEYFSAARMRNPTSYMVVLLLISLSITWFFWNRTTLAQLRAAAEEQKARAAAIEKQAAQAQLQLLQAQIEPHMLFNTLANLQGLIAVDPARAQHMLDHLIRYLRATLSSSRAEQTTLAHEFALMEAYLGLMSVRMGARLSYSLRLPEALSGIKVPPMLLQPLIENAIKHGLEPKIDGGHINVEAAQDAGTLILSVADTGLGLDAVPDHGMQVGLKNVSERLQVLYGDAASVSLAPNVPNGAIAQLKLPLQT